MGLARKLILAVLFICVLFTAVIITVQSSLFKQALLSQQTERLEADGHAAQDFLQQYLQQMKSLTISAAFQKEWETGDVAVIEEALEDFVEQNADSIRFAFFVTNGGTTYSSSQIIFNVLKKTMNYDQPRKIAQSVPTRASVFVSEPYRSSMSTVNAISFARTVYNEERMPIGVVLLEVDLDTVGKKLLMGTNINNHSFMVVSQSGSILLGVQNFEITAKLRDEISEMAMGWAVFKNANESYRAFSGGKTTSDWHAILIMEESNLYGSINQMIQRVTVISIVLLASLTLTITAITRQFIVPLHKLADVMNSTDTVAVPLLISLYEQRKDEIGILTRAFNAMLLRIDKLIQSEKKAAQERTQAEIRALQNQLRPHFLYNTLNAISALVQGGTPEKVPEATNTLIHLLSMCTDKTDPMISLEDEIRTITYYIDLMMLRYSTRIDVEIHVPKKLRSMIVPKLVLQPLVENAIFHGLQSMDKRGLLEIEGYLEKNDLILSVMDNGTGISKEKLNKLLDNTAEGDLHSTGLRNTHLRIQLYFGEMYGLRVRSEQGVGTRVEAVLPINAVEKLKTI